MIVSEACSRSQITRSDKHALIRMKAVKTPKKSCREVLEVFEQPSQGIKSELQSMLANAKNDALSISRGALQRHDDRLENEAMSLKDVAVYLLNLSSIFDKEAMYG